VRTVQRWESEQGLPIHRLPHNKQSTIYAHAHELDAWWEERKTTLETSEFERADAPAAAPESNASASAGARSVEIEHPSTTRQTGGGRRTQVLALSILALLVASGLFIAARFRTDAVPVSNAQQLCASGRKAWNKRTPDGFKEALDLFERATAADPANALAYSGLADTYSLLEAFGVAQKSDALPKARTAALKSVELGPSLGETHASLSFVLWEEGDGENAVREMKQAIELNPVYPTAHHWYALYLQFLGWYQEAIDEARRGWALDPTSPIVGTDLAIMLRSAGRLDEAEQLLEGMLPVHSSFPGVHFQLAEVYRLTGHYESALEQVRRSIALGDDRPPIVARLAWLEARNGNRGEASTAARRLLADQARGRPVSGQSLTEALMAAGDLDAAYTFLQDAVRAKAEWVPMVTTDPLFEDLRRDRRWPPMRREILMLIEGLPKPIVQPVVK
jgi:tetratricopeptide (TPR) repeat protein